jgi:hypothetical protein
VHLLYFTDLHGGTNRGAQIQVELLRLTFPFLLHEGGDSTGTRPITLLYGVLHILPNLFYLCYSFAFREKVTVDGA